MGKEFYKLPPVVLSVHDRMAWAMEAISPNIVSSYRLLKVLCASLLPSTLRQVDPKYRPTGYAVSPYFNSHTLKTIVYNHVEKYPNASYWKTEDLPRRLVGMLEDLHCPPLQDFITGHVDARLIGWRRVGLEKDINALIDTILSGDYLSHSIVEDDNSSTSADHRMWLCRCLGFIHRCRYKEDILLPQVNNLVYTNPPLPNHPILNWCRRYISNYRETNNGVDLSQIPRTNLKELWALYQGGAVGLSQLSASDSYLIVEELRHIGSTVSLSTDDVIDKYMKGYSVVIGRFETSLDDYRLFYPIHLSLYLSSCMTEKLLHLCCRSSFGVDIPDGYHVHNLHMTNIVDHCKVLSGDAWKAVLFYYLINHIISCKYGSPLDIV